MTSLPSGPARPQSQHLAEFEDMYRGGREPFDYDARAIESLRHDRVAEVARGLAGDGRVLDLGCGLGQITARLLRQPARVLAADLSPTAVARARQRLAGAIGANGANGANAANGAAGANAAIGAPAPPAGAGRLPLMLAASALDLPFRSGSLDLVVASDGLVSWHLNEAQRATALHEIVRVVRPGGHALLTEYLRPAQWPSFLAEVAGSGLEVRVAEGIHDRPFYWLESWIRAVRHWPPVRALRRSRGLARGLLGAGRLLGRRGCRHLLVVARRA